jgi:hypothetical protein
MYCISLNTTLWNNHKNDSEATSVSFSSLFLFLFPTLYARLVLIQGQDKSVFTQIELMHTLKVITGLPPIYMSNLHNR